MRIATIAEIRAADAAEYPNANWCEPMDAEYALLTAMGYELLLSEFHRSLRDRGLVYIAEKGDCDDFAWLFRAYLIERNWRSEHAAAPLACRYGHYTDDRLGRHAIVFPTVVDATTGSLVTRALEPQPGSIGVRRLTRTERKTVTYLVG